jgi:ABC-2 type transport system permease protein
MKDHDRDRTRGGAVGGWQVVLQQETRDLWIGGRGMILAFGYSVLLSVIVYLAATNKALNFLEQRESVSLALQVGVGVGPMLALLAAADAISGERERGTLEALLLTPASRAEIVAGKLLATLSLWLAALVISLPYLWFLARGVGVFGEAVAAGAVIGTLLAVFLASLGMLISTFATSNRISLSVSLFLLLALFAPTQLPAGAQQGWAGNLFFRINPITAGEHYMGRLLVEGHAWTQDLSWLVSPIAGAVLFAVVALVIGSRFIRLRGGASG